jgi:prevent-host-death family protein
MAMSSYSVAEARDKLSSLLDKAERGEVVTITRHGRPVAELRGVARAPGRVTKEDMDWLEARLPKLEPSSVSSVELIRQMRDED